MRGLMMDKPLLITDLIQFAAQYHGDTEIVSRSVEGPIHRYTYAEAYARIQRLANALRALGVEEGDRVATMAWNTNRHFELYFAISGIGAVCHTINPRLFPEQIAYIVNHAEDKVVFADTTFMPLFDALHPNLPTVENYVIMTDREHMPETKVPNPLAYEEIVAAAPETAAWPELDERAASSLCYTSGTTGNPKGALYSHRSTVLHTFAIAAAEGIGVNSQDVVLPVVPMFHVNAWGVPYACAMTGTKLVLPGPGMAGDALYEMLAGEEVTITLGVPTIWLGLMQYMEQEGKKLTHLRAMVCGGSAAPASMIAYYEDKAGVEFFHAWGMTEMSPLGTNGNLLHKHQNLPKDERLALKVKQGRAIFGVDLRIVDDAGQELPHDGKAFGELHVRGPWIAGAYYKDEDGTKAAFTDDGWFRTGDVCTLDPDGFMQIVDRAKDVIKSGGEWISSIDLENAAVGHPDVAEAAVIGVSHPKWDERPLLLLVPAEGKSVSKDDMLAYLTDKVAKWWLPDDVIAVEELPHTATGKVLKTKLREQYEDYKLPTA